MALALLDLRDRELRLEERLQALEADIGQIKTQLETSEADRAARLVVIEEQGRQLGQIPALRQEISRLQREDNRLREQLAAIHGSFWYRLGRKIRAL